MCSGVSPAEDWQRPPTVPVMALLGLPVPDGIDGRALTESAEIAPEEHVLVSPERNGLRTMLAVTDFGRARYLDRAWVEV